MSQSTTATASQSGTSLLPDGGVGVITTVHLVLIALVAVAAIAVILVGMRRKRQRTLAEREVVHNAREAGVSERSVESVAETPLAPPPPAAPAVSPPAAPVPAPQPVARPVPVEAEQPAATDPLADEPIAAAAPLAASPATIAPAPVPATPEPATPEPTADPAPNPTDAPVSLLKGLGPKLVARLGELGIATVGQMAALDEDAATRLDAQLGPFSGRMTRDRWIEQARFLAAGDIAGFEAVFGKL
jgi:predicted flap endonuclease-1-like 5' DNA nuclease